MPAPGSRLWDKIHFAPDGGEGANGGEGAGDPPADEEKPVPYREAQKLIKDRDKAKTINRTVMEALGLEAEFVDDETKPGKKKLSIKGLEELKNKLAGDADGKKKPDEQLRQIEERHNAKITKLQGNHTKQLAARDTLISDLAVESPLRAALLAEGAYDDGEGDQAGKFSDLIVLLRPRVKTVVEQNDEDGTAHLVTTVYGDDGKPLTDAKGDPLSIRSLVKQFLDKRPHMRKAEFRRGSGAGGAGGGAGYGARGGGATSALEHGHNTAATVFGVPIGQN